MEKSVTMWEVECDICGKKIVGWHKSHAEYLLLQHKTTHEYEKLLKSVVGVSEVPSEAEVVSITSEQKSWRQRRENHNKEY